MNTNNSAFGFNVNEHSQPIIEPPRRFRLEHFLDGPGICGIIFNQQDLHTVRIETLSAPCVRAAAQACLVTH